MRKRITSTSLFSLIIGVFMICLVAWGQESFPQFKSVSMDQRLAGWNVSESAWVRPIVTNGGGVGFMATVDYFGGIQGYMNSYLSDGVTQSAIFPEIDAEHLLPNAEPYARHLVMASMGERFAQIAADGMNRVNLSVKGKGISGTLKLLLTGDYRQIQLAYGAGGGVLALNGGGYACQIIHVREDGRGLEFGESLGEHLKSTSDPVALSGDGRYVFFVSRKKPAEGTDGFYGSVYESIYRYDCIRKQEIFIGQTGKDASLSCSADGKSVAYICNIGELTGDYSDSKVVVASVDDRSDVIRRMVIPAKGMDCEASQLSAQGNEVVFSARQKNSTSQIYRYSLRSAREDSVLLSVPQLESRDCQVPAISADGRMVAFVVKAADDIGDTYHVVRADCGPELWLQASRGSRGGFQLAIASTAHGQFQLVVASEGEPLKGHFFGADGSEIQLGEWYDMRLLPVQYASAQPEQFDLQVSVRDSVTSMPLSGHMSVEVSMPWSMEAVSVTAEGSLLQASFVSYESLAMSEDGQMVLFTTDGDLLGDLQGELKQQNVYLRSNGRTSRLTGKDRPDLTSKTEKACLSGNGMVVWVVQDGQLKRISTGTVSILTDQPVGNVIQLSSDFEGHSVVWRTLEGAIEYLDATGKRVEICSAGASAFRFSRDGRMVAYSEGRDLFVWNVEETGSARLYQADTELTVCGMSLSGHQVYFTEKGILYGLCHGTEAKPVKIGDFTDATGLRVASSGRLALFNRRGDSEKQQVYARKLLGREAGDILVSSRNGRTPGAEDSDYKNAPACMSADGSVVVFVSFADNLLDADSNHAQDVFKWTDLEFKPEAATMEIAGKGTEDETLKLSILPVSEQGTNVVLSQAKDLPVGAKSVTLLPPSQGRGAYQLQLEPMQDFCGICTVKLTVFDGRETSETKATLTIENVNDAPFWKTDATMVYDCDEGDSLEIDLTGMADDVDLQNPDNEEALSFGTGNAPEDVQLILDKGKLTVKVGYDAVKRTTEKLPLTVSVTVADREKESAEATLQLKVRNVNRPPVAQMQELAVTEGKALTLGTAQFTDPDAGDVLSYVFTVTEGTLRDGKGQTIVSGKKVTAERLPVIYKAAEGRFNTASFAVKAVDESEAESENVMVTVTLKRQAQSVANLWGGSVDGSGKVVWSGFSKGWNLLSVPMELKGEDYRSFVDWLKPVAIWRWNGKASRYEQGTELKAQEGFWVYMEQLPQAMDIQLRGNLGEPWSLSPGWQLTAPEAQAGLEFSYEQKAGTLIRGRSDKRGQGVWRYGKKAEVR